MLNSKSILAIDFGAANLKLAEFTTNEAGGLLLQNYAFKSLGQEGTQESTRESAVQATLKELLAARSSGAKDVNVCAPGFHTFSKFVKLPPVDTSKVTQIIQYEAQQNVPFPLEEVVWDYQILGAAPSGELEVLLVAIKSDIVEGLARTVEDAGLRMQLVDVSPAALCNAFRYNYGDLEGCAMMLDVGAKTSNLLFFEKGNVYSRGINIGANSITQEFAKESKLGWAEAERLKTEQGFVSLGGAYEEPDDPNQAAISKIARQVLTRLHIQVNQTIQFYRGQQGGAAPDRLFLSGGAAIMPYTAQFFSEKLNVPVEYFNPLRSVEIAPELNKEDLAKVAHSLGEVVGLGLRSLAHCPVELNLMPKSTLKRQQFNQRKPYLAAAVVFLALVVFAWGWFYAKVADEKRKALASVKAQVEPLARVQQKMNDASRDLDGAQRRLDGYSAWLRDRSYWTDLLGVLRQIFLNVELRKEKDLKTPVGVWVEKMVPLISPGVLSTVSGQNIVLDLDKLPPGVAAPPPPPPPAGKFGIRRGPSAGAGGPASLTALRPMDTLTLYCRGVNLSNPDRADANTTVAEAVLEDLRGNTNYFDAAETKLTGTLGETDPSGYTFGFQVTVKLKHPVTF